MEKKIPEGIKAVYTENYGEWELLAANLNTNIDYLRCTSCDSVCIHSWAHPRYNICPYCGAKMKKKDETSV